MFYFFRMAKNVCCAQGMNINDCSLNLRVDLAFFTNLIYKEQLHCLDFIFYQMVISSEYCVITFGITIILIEGT